MKQANKELLISGAQSFGHKISPLQLEQFEIYMDVLDKWADKVNLTAIKGEQERTVLLLLDSVAVMPEIRKYYEKLSLTDDQAFKVVDLGSGPGIPGIPIKIMFPQIDMILMESIQKKANFLREAARKLGADKLSVLNCRAEDFIKDGQNISLVLVRAVGDIGTLAGLCGGILAPGGRIFAMKGPDPEDELDKHRSVLDKLGFIHLDTVKYDLPLEHGRRSLVVLEKKPS